MTVLLALASAVAYGLSDFFGGLLSRRSQVWPVAVMAQVSGAVFVLVPALFLPGEPSTTALRGVRCPGWAPAWARCSSTAGSRPGG